MRTLWLSLVMARIVNWSILLLVAYDCSLCPGGLLVSRWAPARCGWLGSRRTPAMTRRTDRGLPTGQPML